MYGSTIIDWCRRTGLHSLSTEVGAHTWAHTFLCNKSMFMPFCEGNSSLRSNLYTGQPQTGLVFVNSGLSSPNLEANWSMTSSFVPWNGPPGPKVNGHRLGSFSRDIYHFFFFWFSLYNLTGKGIVMALSSSKTPRFGFRPSLSTQLKINYCVEKYVPETENRDCTTKKWLSAESVALACWHIKDVA